MKNEILMEALKEHDGFSVAGGQVRVLREVTPGIAQALLDHSAKNQRFVRVGKVSEYARAMKAGKWLWVGDPIRFGSNGEMIDGQHRLSAVIESGVTLHDVVVMVLDAKNAIRYIDQNAPRHLNDLRAVLGRDLADGTLVSAIMCERNDWISWKAKFSIVEREEIYQNFEFLDEVLKLREVARRKHGVWRAGPVSAAIRCMRTSKRASVAFFTAVFDGSGYIEGRSCPQARLLQSTRWA